MKILGIDTHGPTGGASLVVDGEVFADVLLNVQAAHSEQLLSVVEDVLASSPQSAQPPVDGIAVAVGPGSFTGLRIGVVTGKTLAYAWQVPVVGVNTLEALAYQNAFTAPIQLAMVSYRRQHVFAGAFRSSSFTVDEPALQVVLPPGHYRVEDVLSQAAAWGEDVACAGDAVAALRSEIREALEARYVRLAPSWERLHSSAIALYGQHQLANNKHEDVFKLVPQYMRRSEAEIRWESKSKL